MVFLPDTPSCSKLYFLRHGLAGQHGDPKYKDDSLRPLTVEGREKIYRAAQGMQRLGLEFDAVLSSPYLRAQQTAEAVVQIYGLKSKDIHFTDTLLPPATAEKLLKEVRACFPKSKNVLCVGHEPHLTDLVSSLLKSRGPLNIDLKKGSLCSLSIEGTDRTDAALNWLLTAAQLGLLAQGNLTKEKR